eukprot:Hpha_TRINITY_DN4003_c0_g1::TRINITY_DN4003_c0_g1_i2::g.63626::m.63626/K03119/tauD; taurine dioxygenase
MRRQWLGLLGMKGRRAASSRPLLADAAAGFGLVVDHDFSKPAEPDAAAELRRLLSMHGVLIARKQPLLAPQMLAAAQVFGEPAPAQSGSPHALALYIVKDRNATPRASDFWHSDLSYLPQPGGPTLLYALKVPRGPSGESLGDTLFGDAVTAATTLPPELRSKVEGMQARHNLAYNGGCPIADFESGRRPYPPDARHPVLRPHPFTGELALFVNRAYTAGLLGNKSNDLLSDLLEHVTSASARHSWEEGDLLIWDNSRVQHCATTVSLPPGPGFPP